MGSLESSSQLWRDGSARLYEDDVSPALIEAADRLGPTSSEEDHLAWWEAYAAVAGVSDEAMADRAADLLGLYGPMLKTLEGRLSPFAREQLSSLVEGWSDDLPVDLSVQMPKALALDGKASVRFVGTSRFKSPRGFPVIQGRMSLLKDGQTIGDFLVNTGGGASTHTRTNGPLPPGRYWVSNYRVRDKAGFVLNGVGFSLDVDPTPDTPVYGRSLFRIHPDGLSAGTNGCLGLREGKAELKQAANLLQALVAGGRALLTVEY